MCHHPTRWAQNCGSRRKGERRIEVTIPHGGLGTVVLPTLFILSVAIPHGGLRTMAQTQNTQAMNLVSIPHSGLRTIEEILRRHADELSLSELKALANGKECPHPTRWA